jgi:hypothetical protein
LYNIDSGKIINGKIYPAIKMQGMAYFQPIGSSLTLQIKDVEDAIV